MNIRRTSKDIPLNDLKVLFLDCQTTGATPERGDLLEIGWADSLSEDSEVESSVLSFPENLVLPKRILSITGIKQEEVDEGRAEVDVWKELTSLSRKVARADGMRACPAVIHYARFEEPFLRNLHETTSTRKSFPLMIICTHEISKRIYPELPRKGIRAVAGFLGHAVGESRRSADHVRATAFIWRRIIDDLEQSHGVATLNQLVRWMEDESVRVSAGRIYPMEADIRRDLPDRPGVYHMLRSNGEVLYVGKATSLKQRVNSYFRKRAKHPEHILEMLSQAKRLDVTETGTALEAAILETDEIKRLAPQYNKALRTRERRILFCSDEFEEAVNQPDERCRIGPLSSEGTIKTLGALRKVMRAEMLSDLEDDVLTDALGVAPDYGPEGDCLREGIEIAKGELKETVRAGVCLYAVIDLGRDMWIQRLAKKALEEARVTGNVEGDEGDEEEEERVEFVWTPEAVARTAARNVMWGMRELRRARWFTLLSESSIVWSVDRESTSGWRCIVLEKGGIVQHEWLDDSDTCPVPPGYGKKWSERQESFDVETWDRMRVLTTEIKRLLGSGCDIRIRFGPSHVMGNTQLEKLFRWI